VPELVRLTPSHDLKPFDCGNQDLNAFLFEDSKAHLQGLYAVTYIYETPEETIAYFSVLNDSIRQEDTSKNRFKKIVPFIKRGYKSHPAVKVGRFAVSHSYRRKGIGSMLMDYIKGYFLDNNKTGCRFIIVDAYHESLGFYEKNGFDYLTTTDKGKEKRLMYYDLIQFLNIEQ
jgi:GNAT superfamily N-acetyltransferase